MKKKRASLAEELALDLVDVLEALPHGESGRCTEANRALQGVVAAASGVGPRLNMHGGSEV